MSLDEILKKNCTSTSILGPCEPYVGDLQVMGGNSGEDGSVRVGHLNLVSSVQVGQYGSGSGSIIIHAVTPMGRTRSLKR